MTRFNAAHELGFLPNDPSLASGGQDERVLNKISMRAAIAKGFKF